MFFPRWERSFIYYTQPPAWVSLFYLHLLQGKIQPTQHGHLTYRDATCIKVAFSNSNLGENHHIGTTFLGERVPAFAISWDLALLFQQSGHSWTHRLDHTSKDSSVPQTNSALVSLQELSWLHWWSQIQVLLKNITLFYTFHGPLVVLWSFEDWIGSSPSPPQPQLLSPFSACVNVYNAWSVLHSENLRPWRPP